MPQTYIKKLAKKHKISTAAAEKKWEKAKKQASKENKADNFAYVTKIFKSMMNEGKVFNNGFAQFVALREMRDFEPEEDQDNSEDKFNFSFGDNQDSDDISDEDFDDSEYCDPETDPECDISDEDFDDMDQNYDDDYEGHEGHKLSDIIGPDEEDGSDEDFDDMEDRQFGESFSFLKDILTEAKKKKKLKKAYAKSTYHRDYLKTRNKPYRKFQDHESTTNEGVFDFVKGASSAVSDKLKQVPNNLRDIRDSGRSASIVGDIKSLVRSLAQTIFKYNKLKNGSQVREGLGDYFGGVANETGNKLKQAVQPLKDIHNAGKARSLEADLQKLTSVASEQFGQLMNLLSKLDTSKQQQALEQAMQGIPSNIQQAIYRKLNKGKNSAFNSREFNRNSSSI